MNETILIYFIIQLALQYTLWMGIYYILIFLNKFIVNRWTYKYMFKILWWQFFACNIFLSFLAKEITGEGSMVGSANLGASVVLGLYQTYQAYKVTRPLQSKN